VNIDTANQNNVTLTNQQQTSTSQAKVDTWKFELKKHAKSSEDHLAGATFQLEDTDGNVIPLIEVAENTYRRLLAGEDETGESVVTEFTTTSTGNVILEGLDAGTYYLNEIEAPSGYNRLPDKVKVEITSAESGEAEEKALTKGFKVNDTDVADDVADVENQAGTELPSTGGIGTTIFYIVGGLLVICAGVLLVVRKRMSAEND
ncbi:MAG: SpaA isopeptide-forming pilin-related protein, partial [Aristaeellaceae bacterium]